MEIVKLNYKPDTKKDIADSAKASWEIYKAHREVGFSEEQAMQILTCVLTATVMNGANRK